MLYTTETVFRGHPDKVCDQISDAILDACLKGDENSRVACEVAGGKGKIFITGEITTNAEVNYEEITKKVLRDVGYNDNYEVIVNLSKQSGDINLGTNDEVGGAGDQGIMFGYATDETDNYMPLPLVLLQNMAREYDNLRKEKKELRPDGKSQITMKYKNDKPTKIHTIIFSHQHLDIENYEDIRKYVLENIVIKICQEYIDDETKILINPTGRFVTGGFEGDSGLTGRKIIVDTYGSFARHGGGAFSGKDSTKVDRSAAYMLRNIAKNIVAKKMAEKIEIQISYAIGLKDPISIYLNAFNTERASLKEIEKYINSFDLTPAGIRKTLKLKTPIFEKTARFGHFGDEQFSWEKISC